MISKFLPLLKLNIQWLFYNSSSIKTETDDSIDNIKNELLTVCNHSNDDLTINLKGYIHNNTGFVLTLTNMEKITDDIFANWKSIVEKHGYKCSFQYDFQEGWVDVKCQQKQKKKCLKQWHFQMMGYLSLIMLCIWIIWYRRNRMPQQ